MEWFRVLNQVLTTTTGAHNQYYGYYTTALHYIYSVEYYVYRHVLPEV